MRAGVAEVIKHGAITSASDFQAAASWGANVHRAAQHNDFDWSSALTIDVIARSVKTKADVVNADPHEKGRRQILNAGHTVAHALERESDYRLLHGEAVAIGLVVEAELGETAGVTAPGTASSLREALGGAGLPTRLPPGANPDRLIDAMRVDKKSRAGNLAFALLASVGAPAGNDEKGWSLNLDEGLVRDVLRSAARNP